MCGEGLNGRSEDAAKLHFFLSPQITLMHFPRVVWTTTHVCVAVSNVYCVYECGLYVYVVVSKIIEIIAYFSSWRWLELNRTCCSCLNLQPCPRAMCYSYSKPFG